MSDLRKQWAIVQKRPRPLSPAVARRIHEACKSVGIAGYGIDAAYAELVATLPRPVTVWHTKWSEWYWFCRLCRAQSVQWSRASHPDALTAALRHLHDAHGCPNRRTTGEPCDTACIHCHGWQWCAQPSERREL